MSYISPNIEDFSILEVHYSIFIIKDILQFYLWHYKNLIIYYTLGGVGVVRSLSLNGIWLCLVDIFRSSDVV